MTSISNELLIRFMGDKFASNEETDLAMARDFLGMLLDQDHTEIIRLLEEQLKTEPNPERRRGYVLALRESYSPSAAIILMRALRYESDPSVWQMILSVLGDMQPTRAMLESLTISGIDYHVRKEAAEMLLELAQRDGSHIPTSTADRLASLLGTSETISYPIETLLSQTGGASQNTLAMALANSSSHYYAHNILEKAHPDDSWKRLLYPDIQLPSYCQVGRIETMSVQLVMIQSQEQVAPINIDFSPNEMEVELRVLVSSSDVTVQEDWATISVQHAGNSTTAQFQILPQIEGPASLMVEFFKEGHRIGLLMVRTFVTAPGEGLPYSEEIERWLRQQVISLENPTIHLNAKPYGVTFLAQLRRSPNPGDHVEWFEPSQAVPQGALSPQPIDWQDGESFFESVRVNIAKVLEKTYELEQDLGRLLTDGSDEALKKHPSYPEYQKYLDFMLFDLRAIGRNLFSDIVAPEIRQHVAKLEMGTHLQFRGDPKLAWIPWEMVYDEEREAFWGEIFPITRLSSPLSDPLGHRPEVSENGSSPPQIINVAGDKLVPIRQWEALVARLQKIFQGWPTSGNVEIPFEPYSVPQFTSVIREGKLVHLTCIGDRDNQGTYYLRLGPDFITDRFKLYHVDEIMFRAQPLVFTNACSTTSGNLTLSGYSNFAWEIYSQGAAAYIGTIAPVPTERAISFAETLYEALIAQNLTVGEALWTTKCSFAKSEPLHPFYLLYCLYGDTQWRWPEVAG